MENLDPFSECYEKNPDKTKHGNLLISLEIISTANQCAPAKIIVSFWYFPYNTPLLCNAV